MRCTTLPSGVKRLQPSTILPTAPWCHSLPHAPGGIRVVSSGPGLLGISGSVGLGLCRITDVTNFREHPPSRHYEYPGEWVWATPRTGLPLLRGEPKLHSGWLVDR